MEHFSKKDMNDHEAAKAIFEINMASMDKCVDDPECVKARESFRMYDTRWNKHPYYFNYFNLWYPESRESNYYTIEHFLQRKSCQEIADKYVHVSEKVSEKYDLRINNTPWYKKLLNLNFDNECDIEFVRKSE